MILNYIEQLANAPPFTVISVLTVLLSVLYLYFKNRNLPPGPTGVPILGYWPFLEDKSVYIQLTEMKKKYGDVYSFNVAGKLLIHLGSIKAIKEAHVTKGDRFSQRGTGYSLFTATLEEGIIVSNGEHWITLRKFFTQAFREYGMSSLKEYMTGPVYDCVNASVRDLKAFVGKTVNIVPILQTHSVDIFRYMMFRNNNITEEELRAIAQFFDSVDLFGTSKNILLSGDIAKYLIFPRRNGYKEMLADCKGMEQLMRTMIQRHEKSYNPENIRDMVDDFIKERNERRQKGDPTAKYFTEIALVSSLFQMIGDGILTFGTLIGYFVHALLRYPEEQEKIHKELEDLAGSDRQITLEDKSKLPYTNAFIQEVMRTTNFFPLFIGYECTSKRSCIGEYFITMQVFLFLTALIKNFRIEGSKTDAKIPDFDKNMEVTVFLRK